MHTRTCSHFLVLTYASTNTRAHISAACGRHPQCCETSCIPHAYITPFPPPPADHSSFYPALALSLSLSPSLSLLLKSVWLVPSSSEQSFVTFYTRGIRGAHPHREIRLNCEKLTRTSGSYWDFNGKAAPPHVCSFVFNTHTLQSNGPKCLLGFLHSVNWCSYHTWFFWLQLCFH